jgi:mycothiol synthase
MDISQISIKPADPTLHFASIAALMTAQQTEPTTEQSLFDWYKRQQEQGIQFEVGLSPDSRVLGFTGIYRMVGSRQQCYGVYLIVSPEYRHHGFGSLLYQSLLRLASEVEANTLVTWVRDNSPESQHFATQRGFIQKRHSIEMCLNLASWDDRPYEAIVQSLQAQGFSFTNIAELGDTEEARRRLYTLNNTTAATDPGSDGSSPWATFEDFDRSICQANWYRPEGQIVAIDTHTGEWAAMSAITVFDGADHAYNLFTGTDVRYRGRKLAQAVKTLALLKARTFGVDTVRTSHTSINEPMIAIDTKLGYVRKPGTFIMEKNLTHA